ncbi:hypothetical protein RRG08_011874 [Elysia crispata]|uniref:Uncharacterized protein n=1 Tax=Elysia crispata TaxID=231223 RepID=A0AAE1DIL5_9GAST|nr:hypothetical protein RRG08_011874 [Elysia crispata]
MNGQLFRIPTSDWLTAEAGWRAAWPGVCFLVQTLHSDQKYKLCWLKVLSGTMTTAPRYESGSATLSTLFSTSDQWGKLNQRRLTHVGL